MGFLYSQFFVTPAIPTADLSGQTLIITGSNTGLGYAAAVHIARLKPRCLILAVRNLEKGNAARTRILTEANVDTSTTSIEVWQLDMSSFASVLAFSDRCAQLDRLDGVSLNAGIQVNKFELVEGYESTITINVVSTFLLAVALLPVLRQSAEKHHISPRLSIVSSETHAWAPWPEKKTPEGENILKAMSKEGSGVAQARYMDSKLMQILVFRHMVKLADAKEKSSMIMNILNPGFCYSDLGGSDAPMLQTVMRRVLARTQDIGGRPIAAGLVAGKDTNGQYMHDGVVDDAALSSYVKSEDGKAMGERLWNELKAVFDDLRPGLTAVV